MVSYHRLIIECEIRNNRNPQSIEIKVFFQHIKFMSQRVFALLSFAIYSCFICSSVFLLIKQKGVQYSIEGGMLLINVFVSDLRSYAECCRTCRLKYATRTGGTIRTPVSTEAETRVFQVFSMGERSYTLFIYFS